MDTKITEAKISMLPVSNTLRKFNVLESAN